VKDLVEAGGNRISIHAETAPHLHRTLDLIHRSGAQAGVVLNPATSVDSVADALKDVDVLTILSADPASGTEVFLPHSVVKIAAAARLRAGQELNFLIEAEGGLGLHNLREAVRVGADILVIGSAIFDHEDPEARLREFRELAAAAPERV
jgi:ribulose-phosphate 3-epimerase